MSQPVDDFFSSMFHVLYGPAEQTWNDCLERIDRDRRDEIEGLASTGFPMVIVPLDASWEIPGPCRIVIIVPKEDGEKVFEVGRTSLTQDYRNALLDFCKVALGDLHQRQGLVHDLHQSGSLALSLLADIKQRKLRLLASMDHGRINIGLVDVAGDAVPVPEVLH